MPELGKKFTALIGGILTILGLAGVPLSIKTGSTTKLFLSTLSFFAGIFVLGWAAKQ
jgi:hypothetical protein